MRADPADLEELGYQVDEVRYPLGCLIRAAARRWSRNGRIHPRLRSDAACHFRDEADKAEGAQQAPWSSYPLDGQAALMTLRPWLWTYSTAGM
jgi:hypothetical protein